ncbi:Uncharacterised protein [uncultured archaeon]|nr:Uncharacterised protein [uncultured archaeon]
MKKEREWAKKAREIIRSHWPFLVIFLIAIFFYLHNIGALSFWSDEIWVAKSVSLTPTIESMIYFTETPQSTPPLFLLALKGIIFVLGTSEWAFRILSAICIILSVALVYLLALKISKKWFSGGDKKFALISAAFFAFNPLTQRYAQELKQYAGDMLSFLLLLNLAEWYFESRSKKSFWALVLACIILPWFSQASIFLVAVICTRFVYEFLWKEKGLARIISRRLTKENLREIKNTIIIILTAGVSFAAEYYLILAKVTGNSILLNYWETMHTQLFPLWKVNLFSLSGFSDFINFVVSHTYSIFSFLFRNFYRLDLMIILILFLCFIFIAFNKNRAFLFTVLGIFAFNLLAALAGKFPYGGTRVVLFFLPILSIAVVYALCQLIITHKSLFRHYLKITLVILAVLLLFGTYIHFFTVYSLAENAKPLLEKYVAEKKQGEFTMIYEGSRINFGYYCPACADNKTIYINAPNGMGEQYLEKTQTQIGKMDSGARIWLFFSTFSSVGFTTNEMNQVVEYFDMSCVKLKEYDDVGAWLYLYKC